MKVTFDNVYNAFQIIAPKGTMISFTGEPTALADGVYLVGDDGIINLDEQFLTDTLYLSTEGTDYAVTGGMRVTYPLGDETVIIRAGSSTIPFSKGGKGGGSGSGTTKYKGTTTTPISNGSTTNPITIDGEEYTAVFGDIVVYGYTEFVFDGTTWSEFGRPFDTTPTSGSANAVTSDGIYQRTPLSRSIGLETAVNSNCIASGNNSIAFGYTCRATGADAFTVGGGANAGGVYSAALNKYTNASQEAMTAIGKYNSPRTGDLFNIGNGNANARSNILEVNAISMNVNGAIQRGGVGIDDYTTTERKIGKWIDGSDLYQRTFEVTGLTESDSWVFNNNILGTSDIDIKDFKGYTEWSDGTNTTRFDLNFYLSSGIHSLCLNAVSDLAISLNHESTSFVKAIITIKYTKPSANLMQTAIPTEEVSETPIEDDVR